MSHFRTRKDYSSLLPVGERETTYTQSYGLNHKRSRISLETISVAIADS
ncbi:MAG: hypothetical protein KME06_18035 [Kastovskya adunca ATA6-11-RM4]|nr:hypothetical protein [Kastovskya adunca ATA6-11-RM4]